MCNVEWQYNVLNKKDPIVLMNKNVPVLEFMLSKNILEKTQVLKIFNSELLPYALKNDLERIGDWLEKRAIPTNREHIERVYESFQLNKKGSATDLLLISRALSVNDTYWFKHEYEEIDYNTLNLYTNDFKESLGYITFFGNTSSLGGNIRTPELTTQGMLGKAWRKINNELYLFKKGTSGYANSGNEPYSEYVASQIAKILGLNHVNYSLHTWENILCSVCKCFSDMNIGYLTMSEFLGTEVGMNIKWDLPTVSKYLTDKQLLAIYDMLVYDYIIENSDRHFSNFGFLIDNDSRRIVDIAPIFDNGYSLLNFEMENDLANMDYSSYSVTGTFGFSNKDQATTVVSMNRQRYKHWAKELMLHIDDIDMRCMPLYRQEGVRKLLVNRCNSIMSM